MRRIPGDLRGLDSTAAFACGNPPGTRNWRYHRLTLGAVFARGKIERLQPWEFRLGSAPHMPFRNATLVSEPVMSEKKVSGSESTEQVSIPTLNGRKRSSAEG